MRIAAALGLSCLVAKASFGATAPDWVKAALAGDIAAWRPTGEAIVLLESKSVHFLPPDGSTARLLSRSVLRIRMESGLARAVARLPYNPNTSRILSARAWVVSADGTRTKAFDRGDFVDVAALVSRVIWNNQRILAFDGTGRTEVGGTLAWEFEAEVQNELGESQQSFLPAIPVLRSDFDAVPCPGGRLDWFATASRLRSPVPGIEPGSLHWGLKRVAPLAGERPAAFLPNRLVVWVHCARPGTPPGSNRSWADISRLVDGIMSPRIDAGAAIKARCEELVAGKSDRWDRIRAITEFVQRQIVYLSVTLDTDSLAGLRPHPAAEVLRNRFGDCKDKAILLISMLRAIGEDGHAVLLFPNNQKAVDPEWPTVEAFDHAIVAIPADGQVPEWWPVVSLAGVGRVVIFDPTDPTTPLGLLSLPDQGGWGLTVAPAEGVLFSLPAADPAHSHLERRIEAVLDAAGTMEVKVTTNETGAIGAFSETVRSHVSAEEFKRRIESRIHSSLPLAKGMRWSDDWDAHLARYRLNFDFSVPGYGRPMSNGMILVSPDILPDATTLAPWRTRSEGSAWIPAEALTSEVRLHLPDGYEVEEMPDPWSQDGGNASCQVGYRVDGREVVFLVTLERPGGAVDQAGYEALREFYRKAHDAERRPILLRHAS